MKTKSKKKSPKVKKCNRKMITKLLEQIAKEPREDIKENLIKLLKIEKKKK
jgi:hypothetical protein